MGDLLDTGQSLALLRAPGSSQEPSRRPAQTRVLKAGAFASLPPKCTGGSPFGVLGEQIHRRAVLEPALSHRPRLGFESTSRFGASYARTR